MPEPRIYYQDDAVTLWLGDCREVLPTLNYSVFITDPPYGVNMGSSTNTGGDHGLLRAGYDQFDDSRESFAETVPTVIRQCAITAKRGAVFIGKNFTLLPEPSTIGGIYVAAACGRNAWGFSNLVPIFFYGSDPNHARGSRHTVLQSSERAELNGHPCPKPYGWLMWLVDFSSLVGDTIVDPFAGSGTTLVAAKQQGRKAIGVELSERYCEVAARRLSQGALDLFGADPPRAAGGMG